MKCRHCASHLEHTFIDLGFAPLSNSYLTESDLIKPEKYYPLKIKVCNYCWLVQTEDYAQVDELFNDKYAYFSSTSKTWLTHAASYAKLIINRLQLNKKSHVLEIASNDGYLLRNFVEAGIPCLGIEPTASTALVAEKLGIPVIRQFFDEALGKQLSKGKQSDLIVANNVYAHVPDINDFTLGLTAALKPNGTITLEFPHLMRLIEHVQFDTVYHEHFSYLSLCVVQKIFKKAGLRIWDVEQLPTHGGSLRVYGCHEGADRLANQAVELLLLEEERRGLQDLTQYQKFQECANKVKDDLVMFLTEQKRAGKKIAAYGAAAKGNTLLNYAGVKPNLLPFVCDAALSKQGMFMPGSHIPIMHPDFLKLNQLDYVLILPWNIAAEVKEQNTFLSENGTKFLTAIPKLQIE